MAQLCQDGEKFVLCTLEFIPEKYLEMGMKVCVHLPRTRLSLSGEEGWVLAAWPHQSLVPCSTLKR